jgi:hypothetical protein
MSVKISRKGNNLVYRAEGVALDVDVTKVKDLHNVAVFLGSLDLPEEKRKVRVLRKEKTQAPEVELSSSMGDDIVQLIASGVDTEEGLVAALQDKLVAAGKKSPRRSVNTGLRHAKNAGTIRELPDGKFAVGRR